MNPHDCLNSLEILRDFVQKFVPLPTYMKNLIIDRIETPNRRLWILRESIELDEAQFALSFGMALDEYHQYERDDISVPVEFLENVAERLLIPIEWLRCECPVLPVPKSGKV
jgi:hypothetical protein